MAPGSRADGPSAEMMGMYVGRIAVPSGCLGHSPLPAGGWVCVFVSG